MDVLKGKRYSSHFSLAYIYTATVTSVSPGYCGAMRPWGNWQLSPDNQLQADTASSEVLRGAKSDKSSKNHRPGEVESRRGDMGTEEKKPRTLVNEL